MDMEVLEGELIGSLLKDRYYIARLIDQGSFGKVYKCIDVKNQDRPLVIKISEDPRIFRKEVRAMKSINKVFKNLYSGDDSKL